VLCHTAFLSNVVWSLFLLILGKVASNIVVLVIIVLTILHKNVANWTLPHLQTHFGIFFKLANDSFINKWFIKNDQIQYKRTQLACTYYRLFYIVLLCNCLPTSLFVKLRQKIRWATTMYFKLLKKLNNQYKLLFHRIQKQMHCGPELSETFNFSRKRLKVNHFSDNGKAQSINQVLC